MATSEPKASVEAISQAHLPDGISLAAWSLEQRTQQNPRIRGLLGCVRVLDDVSESNFAILNCSPGRLSQIWNEVRKVCETLKKDVAPLLRGSSVIPGLEDARASAETYLDVLSCDLLTQIERYPKQLSQGEGQQTEVRRLLCVAIGQIQSFLFDSLGALLANDPRSIHDSDFFLRRRFARDVDEAEWLHCSVSRLEKYLERLVERPGRLRAVADRLEAEQRVPSADHWAPAAAIVGVLLKGLTPRLKSVLALRGIRLSELELLDSWATDIPAMCNVLTDLHATATEVTQTMKQELTKAAMSNPDQVAMAAARSLSVTTHAVFCRRLAALMRSIDSRCRDLEAFLTIWREGVGKRRALLLSGIGQ